MQTQGVISSDSILSKECAFFGVNGGRVADVATGKNGQGNVTADKPALPAPGPYMAGRSAMRARDTLIALRDLIDEAIKDIDKFEKLDKM